MDQRVSTSDVIAVLNWLRDLAGECEAATGESMSAEEALNAAIEEVEALGSHPYRIRFPGTDPPHPFAARAVAESCGPPKSIDK